MIIVTKVGMNRCYVGVQLDIMYAMVWNVEILVIASMIGWVNISRMDSMDNVDIFINSGFVCDAVIFMNNY